MDAVTDDSGAAPQEGLWTRFSFMNHNCVPNTSRAFLGDVVIVRATRTIKKGEELLTSYRSVNIDFDEDRVALMGEWDFQCRCALCKAEEKVPADVRAKRNLLSKQIIVSLRSAGGLSLLTPGGQASKPFEKTVKLILSLTAMFDDRLFPKGMPRRGLYELHSMAKTVHENHKRFSQARDSAMDAIRASGPSVDIDGSGNVFFDMDNGCGHSMLITAQLKACARLSWRLGQVGIQKQFQTIAEKIHRLDNIKLERFDDPLMGFMDKLHL